MKLSKFARLVKQTGSLVMLHVGGGGLWLSNGYAVYKATGLPDSVDSETILAVLDFDSKTAQKIRVQEKSVESVYNLLGLDLSDEMEQDISASRSSITVAYKGKIATALLCRDGELVFYNEAYATPLLDVFRESDYVQTVVRRTESGMPYVVIRDGMETLARILPIQMISQSFLSELQDFEQRCADQFVRERYRVQTTVQQADEIEHSEQLGMEGLGDED